MAELAEGVALELHASLSRSTDSTPTDTVSGTDIGSSASAGVQGCQNDSDLDQSGQVGEGGGHGGQGGQRDGQQGSHGQGDQEGQCGQRGRGGQRDRGGGGGYGGGDQGVEPLSPEGRLFRDITSTIILVDSFMTPEKN